MDPNQFSIIVQFQDPVAVSESPASASGVSGTRTILKFRLLATGCRARALVLWKQTLRNLKYSACAVMLCNLGYAVYAVECNAI